MTRRLSLGVFGLLVLGCAAAAIGPSFAQERAGTAHWVTTWATATFALASQAEPGTGQAPAGQPAPPRFSNQTLRQIVHTSLGGEQIRVVLANTFGTAPLDIGAGRVALRLEESEIVPGSSRALTFGDRSSTSVPAGAVMVSDPVTLTVPALSDLVVDLHLPGDTGAGPSPLTRHGLALQTNYVSTAGDHTGAAEFPVASTTTSWFFLARVEVMAPVEVSAVVALGNSITDGARSTTDANSRWPDHLAGRLASRAVPMGVANMGIAGNRLLNGGLGPPALSRFDRDVLAAPGVTHLVVMEGINDIGAGVGADDLIAGHRQIIERARAAGLTVIGATLTPFEDATFEGYYTPDHEAARQALNQWIRTSGAYDAIIDFDALVRDAARPTRLQSQYAAPDNIHPNDAGYRSMADGVDLQLFASQQPALSR